MSYNKQENVINEEQIASYLKDVLSRVESDSDPDSLNTLKKLFKKNIPFSRRMYVAAYLVKQANGGYRGNRFNKNDRFSHDRNDRSFDRRNERTQRPSRNDKTEKFADRSDRTEHAEHSVEHETEHTERAPRVQIDASLATTIFIGIGRNRRVYPRDLVGLLVSVAGLDRERIGDIRVLANYSFIQLFTEDCEKAIAALNGYDYRGRKLSVSYSRQREEGDEDNGDSTSADVSNAKSNDTGNVASSNYSAPVDNSSNEGSAAVENNSISSDSNDDERIPENVSNDSSSVHSESSEETKIAAEQKAFASEQKSVPVSKPADVAAEKPFSETTDDGQVKSHFGSGNSGSNYLV